MKSVFKIIFTLLIFKGILLASIINVDTLVISAYKEKKIPLVYLHRIGCNYCNLMEEFTLDDDNVIEYIKNNFVLININVSLGDTVIYKKQKMSAKEFATTTGYAFYPASLFLSKENEVFEALMGYRDEKSYLKELQTIKNSQE